MQKRKKLHTPHLFLTLLALVLMALPAGNSLAMGQVTMTVKNPDPYLGNHSWFIYEAEPGKVIEDVATLKNFSTEVTTVSIYAVDALSSESGSFILKFEGEEQKGIGVWTDVEKRSVTVKPNEVVDLPFTITLPENISPGQYIGGLVVENEGEGGAAVRNRDDCTDQLCGGNIAIKTRIGSRIYLTVPGETVEDISLTDMKAEKTLTGTTKFEFTIVNNGNITYEPEAVIDVLDSLGNPYDRIEKTLGTSSPHSVIKPVVKMTERPLIGNFTAKATVTFNRKFISSELHGANLAQTKSITFWVMPWEVLLCVFFVIMILVGIRAKVRQTEKAYRENGETYVVQATDDIMSIAKRRNASWKKIARYNNLQPPFVLKAGDKLTVPKKRKTKNETQTS